MSGLNNRKWKYLLYTFSTIYFISIVLLIFFILNFSNNYENANEKHIDSVKSSISTILNDSDVSVSDELNELMKVSPFEAIILDEQKEIYRSNETKTFTEFNNMINQQAIIYADSYTEIIANQTYTIALAIYPPNYRELYPKFLINVSIIITIIFISIFIVLLTLQKEMLKPIERLKVLIQRIKNFEFGNNKRMNVDERGYDALTHALEEFSDEMQGKIIDLEERYTGLEISLQAENELNTYKTQLVSSLIHDLKTPLNIMILQLDKFIKLSKDKQNIIQFESMKEESYEVVDNIKNILEIMNADTRDQRSITKFDVVPIIRTTFKTFNPIIQQKNYNVEIDMPREIIIEMDEIECKLIIHNAISNAMQYTPENGRIIFEAAIVNQMLELSLYNDSISQDIDYSRVFELFYNLGNAETKRMSSGVGMYTIQHMVNLYNGKVSFFPEKDGVRLFVQIPQLGSDADV